MKKTKKIRTILILSFCILTAYAMTLGTVNASFADFGDEQAAEETQKMQQEQQEHVIVGKSTNNYLDSLKVVGYKLTPDFDKQTLEYTLSEKLKGKTIEIKATASDEKAKIEGIGKITLESDQKQCRIDVTAESGTVRTYFIYFEQNPITEEEKEQQGEITTEIQPEELEETKENNSTFEVNSKIILILCIVFVIAIFLVLLQVRKRKKTRNSGKHGK